MHLSVLDWSTVNKTCEKGSTNYACGENTYCSYSNDSRGFLCHCIEGYQGDPYLPEGCQAAESTSLETKPGCQNKCGNVSIPYPFGLDGDDPTCFRDEFKLFCNTATDPPQLLMSTEFPVMDISLQGQLITLSTWASIYCYTGDNQSYVYNTSIELPNVYRFSYTRNQFTAVGCNTLGVLSDYNSTKFNLGCISSCPYDTVLTGRPCDGIGCCQTAIPKDLPAFTLSVGEYAKTTNKSNSWKISRCGLAFLSDQMWFTSNASSLWNSRNDVDRIVNIGITTPVVLDWAIREKNCKEAQRANDYACGKNANCTDSTNGPGYLCHCLNGYHGNPYLPTGCQDINECEDPKNNPCVSSCTNTIGSYYCSCPNNSYGDGRKDGQRCIAKSKAFPVIKVILGIGFGAIFLLIGGSWLNFIIRKRKLLRLKEKFFQQNGGMLLQQRISSHEGGFEFLKIFTAEELEMATNRYNEDCILGRGGQGTVYKGVLPDHRVVATKKSKVVDDGKIEQFINEIIILSQVNHRNVVKLLGCCLETEIPLLVYEYVSNGTLFDHIQRKNGISLLSWEDRLRIAIETAGAFAYLHSAASIPIIHRDIKSTNILLDDNYAAKVSDFGISRLLPTDRDQVTTLVQGTLGYLDPEYFHSGLLTEKSDVYSFGVVLVELLTGEKPVCFERSQEQRNLATYFVSSMKENHLLQIIEDELLDDRVAEKIFAVADLTNRCLNISGEHRPTMKEVAMELEGLKRLEIKSCVQELKGENVSLQSGITTPIFVPLRHYPSDASMQYSLEKDALLSMAFPR
uniref:Wall-associated receptor kinase 2-like n=1 Tax=Nelumbo nucifera TaxID=4432 RepID=A0A822XXK2_NELNU|nr:TPA_asm: hypothetical protein HUJ06_025917 [Nelumbo nucifera]